MGKQKSLKSKAVHFVSDLTTVFLNPISDKPSKPPPPPPPPHHHHNPTSTENVDESKKNQVELINEEGSTLADEPDTSSFTAFLYSLLSSSEGNDANLGEQTDVSAEKIDEPSENVVRESGGRRGLLSKGKQSLRALYQVAKLGGLRSQERRSDLQIKVADKEDDNLNGLELKDMENAEEPVSPGVLPGISEPSMLLSEKSRSNLYASLPALVQGRKWLLLYSTWRHGISLSTLYRRSMLWPGLSLLVVGDRKGAVFGGLVEAPLRPTNKRKYQGTNNTFVFTNTSGSPVIFRPTGANRYFTLCSTDFLAIGGGGHFALYLDGDLLSGSSAVSETYGNPCLAFSEDFEVKEVELWGFVYGSRYEEILGMSRTEAPGICRW